jgi:dihydropteroate synthase
MFTLNCRGRLMVINDPVIMSIINVTPDSFYKGSRQQDMDQLLRTAENMLNEGAAILDIGGQSSRPGSEWISAEEELQRVIKPIEALAARFPESFISVDTFYASVAAQAIDAGAVIVNDISGGEWDDQLIPVVVSKKVPYVLMHRKGSREEMHKQTSYENVTVEVLDYLSHRKARLIDEGIHDVIVDPGFGFSKTIEQNFELLRGLSAFQMLESPVMIGLSRKSTVYRTLAVQPEDALNGTTVLQTVGLMNGANIVRCHDVKEAVEAVRLLKAGGYLLNK